MSQSTSTTSRSSSPSSTETKREPSGVIETTSPSSISWIERVSPMKAATIEARYISPSPTPTSSGHWCRAPTSSSGWSWWMTTKAKWPSSSR